MIKNKNDSINSLIIGDNVMTYLYFLIIFPHLLSCFSIAFNHEHKITKPMVNHMNIKMMSGRLLWRDHPCLISKFDNSGVFESKLIQSISCFNGGKDSNLIRLNDIDSNLMPFKKLIIFCGKYIFVKSINNIICC